MSMEISQIRTILQECENSIIFAIFERSRWKSNPSAYQINPETGESLFTSMLKGIERVHARAGRYRCPEEQPFTKNLDLTQIRDSGRTYQLDNYLDSRHISINNNEIITEKYFRLLLPKITEEGEDENLGSAVTADINLLQALSRRIHLGKLVAQTKYDSDKEWYGKSHTDREFFVKLTNTQVENNILKRLEQKIKNFSNDMASNFPNINLNPTFIVDIYQDMIIPETKQVQIQYFKLLNNI